jgi:hypothetical protein
MRDTQQSKRCLKALKRLKKDATYQEVADYLTSRNVEDGRIIWKVEIWRWIKKGIQSPKVMIALEAAGEIPGPQKRYRLHAEFKSKEAMQEFMKHYGIDNKKYTFTNWTNAQLEYSLYMMSDFEHLEYMNHN